MVDKTGTTWHANSDVTQSLRTLAMFNQRVAYTSSGLPLAPTHRHHHATHGGCVSTGWSRKPLPSQ
eukprot:11051925-Alexandrium_andersonii.AAC.1